MSLTVTYDFTHEKPGGHLGNWHNLHFISEFDIQNLTHHDLARIQIIFFENTDRPVVHLRAYELNCVGASGCYRVHE